MKFLSIDYGSIGRKDRARRLSSFRECRENVTIDLTVGASHCCLYFHVDAYISHIFQYVSIMNLEDLPGEVLEMVVERMDDLERFGSFSLVSTKFYTLAWTSPLRTLDFIHNKAFNSVLRKCMEYLSNYSEENVVTEQEILTCFVASITNAISSSSTLSLLPLASTKRLVLPGLLPSGFVQALCRLTPMIRSLRAIGIVDSFEHLRREMQWFDDELQFKLSFLQNLKDLTIDNLKCRICSDFMTRLQSLKLFYDFASSPTDEISFPSPNYTNLVNDISRARDLQSIAINFSVPLHQLLKLKSASLVLRRMSDLSHFEGANLVNLRKLKLRLELVGAAFPDLNTFTNLESLELHNAYYVENSSVCGLKNLKKLTLHCDSQLVLSTFRNLTNLEYFSLVGTKNRRLAEEESSIILNSFSNLKALKLMNLSLNEDVLVRIPKALTQLRYLKLHLALFRAGKGHVVESMLRSLNSKQMKVLSLKGLPLSPSFVSQLPFIFKAANRLDILTSDKVEDDNASDSEDY